MNDELRMMKEGSEGENPNSTTVAHAHEIALMRTVHVPLEKLWQAWADPDMLARWFTDEAEQDFRMGGRYSNSDGDRGEFLRIEPLTTISFTWEQPDYTPGSIVTVHFRPLSEEVSEVALAHTGVACDDEADLHMAWNWALNSLVSWLETGRRL